LNDDPTPDPGPGYYDEDDIKNSNADELRGMLGEEEKDGIERLTTPTKLPRTTYLDDEYP